MVWEELVFVETQNFYHSRMSMLCAYSCISLLQIWNGWFLRRRVITIKVSIYLSAVPFSSRLHVHRIYIHTFLVSCLETKSGEENSEEGGNMEVDIG